MSRLLTRHDSTAPCPAEGIRIGKPLPDTAQTLYARPRGNDLPFPQNFLIRFDSKTIFLLRSERQGL